MENKSFRINVNVGHSPGGVTLMSLELLQPAGALPASLSSRPTGRAATAAGLGREINLSLEEVIFRPNVHVVVPGRNGSLFYIFDR